MPKKDQNKTPKKPQTKKVDPNDLLTVFLGGLEVRSGSGGSDIEANDRHLETIKQLGEMIFSTDHIESKTNLKTKQIYAFALASWFAETEAIPELALFVDKLSIYSISDGGLSRKQFESVAKSLAMYSGEVERDERKTLKEHLYGGGE